MLVASRHQKGHHVRNLAILLVLGYTLSVGLQRGGYGNPFDVSTVSGKPMAAAMQNAVLNSLKKAGINVTGVILDHKVKTPGAIQALIQTGKDRLVLITLWEWKSDTYTNVGLYYHVTLDVLGRDGGVIARYTIKGKDNLGGSAWNPGKVARREVPIAFRRKLEELFNNERVRAALQ